VTAPEQGALFDAPAKPRRKTWAERLEEIVPRYAPGEARPWDVLSPEDEELGWEHRYVDHRRAVEIRLELGRG
jgi:hypothetical protein